MENFEYSHALTAVLTTSITAWLVGKVRFQATSSEGRRVLKYSKGFLAAGWVGVVFFGGILILTVFSDNPTGHSVKVQGGFAGFALLGALLVRMYHRCSLEYGDETITYQPLWGEPISFVWADVKKATYNSLAEWWRLRLEDGRSARVGMMMHGAVEFMQTLARRGKVSIDSVTLKNGTRVHFYASPSDASMRRNSPSDQA